MGAENVNSDTGEVYGEIDGDEVVLTVPKLYGDWQDDLLTEARSEETSYWFTGEELAGVLTGFIEEE